MSLTAPPLLRLNHPSSAFRRAVVRSTTFTNASPSTRSPGPRREGRPLPGLLNTVGSPVTAAAQGRGEGGETKKGGEIDGKCPLSHPLYMTNSSKIFEKAASGPFPPCFAPLSFSRLHVRVEGRLPEEGGGVPRCTSRMCRWGSVLLNPPPDKAPRAPPLPPAAGAILRLAASSDSAWKAGIWQGEKGR